MCRSSTSSTAALPSTMPMTMRNGMPPATPRVEDTAGPRARPMAVLVRSMVAAATATARNSSSRRIHARSIRSIFQAIAAMAGSRGRLGLGQVIAVPFLGQLGEGAVLVHGLDDLLDL